MNIRPVEIPLLRLEMLQAAQKIANAGMAGFDWINNLSPDDERSTTRDFIRGTGPTVLRMARDECRRLAMADLYFVAAPMGRVAIEAAKKLPHFELLPEDMPSETGFMFFEEALNAGNGKAPVAAASWSCTDHGTASIAWYFEKRWPLTQMEQKQVGPLLLQSLTTGPRLQAFDLTSVPFGPGEVLSVGGMDGRTHPISDHQACWLGELKTVWLLMSQPVAAVADAVYARADRRRIQREQQEPPRVRVITLRRPANSTAGGESDREYHHQWIVRGHWRQQWYPGREVHRPVWIAPHVKGPEGAPMLGGEKVYAWTR